MSVTIGKGKLAAIFISAAIICAVVGVACWFGKPSAEEGGDGDDGDNGGGDSGHVKNESEEDEFPPGTAPWLNLYLPSYTIPKHYDLTLHPDFYGSNTEFNGEVTIEIDVRQATWHLLFHIKKLTVEVISIKNKKTDEEYGKAKEWGYEPNQFWIVKTEKMIEESTTVLLTIKFRGSLIEGIVGLYKAFYANNTKSMATSKFQPTDARKAFPCFDEPNLKATFTTTLIHEPDYTALSNMPVEKVTTREGLHVTQFQKSVPMSTYLACFIVCKCGHQEIILKSGKPFRVYAVEGSVDQVEYATEFGANVTDYFEGYFGLDYPLPKMDMIAIPDFVSGAMEHWGLITYRETNLLYKEGVSSPSNKQRIAEVVAHELAHQWFGNIVTMEWWDDLWLNEGFATFMSYVGTQPFEPEMEVFSQFSPIEAFRVMPEDSVASSHPIIVAVDRPENITAVFDAISYNKGASVIRMLESFVGSKIFEESLTAFLKRYQYDNARTYQLWDSISEKVNENSFKLDIEHIMNTWTKQSGFPLVTVEYNSAQQKITVKQALYKDKDDTAEWDPSEYNYQWEVPLHYVSSGTNLGEDYSWLHSNSSTITIDSPVDLSSDSEWLKFNNGTTGYYRVNYPDDWWKKFETLLKADPESMAIGDRSGLLNDAMSMAKYGHLSYAVALNFTSYMKKEKHYVAWISVNSELFEIRDMLGTDDWKSFVQDLVQQTYDDLAWKDGGSHLDKLLRGTVIRLACGHKYAVCLDTAKDKFTQWLADPENNPLDVTFRRDVITYGMRNVTEAEWDTVWDLYNSEPVASAKVDLRRGLAQTTDTELINKYLSYAMDKKKIVDQDFFSVIAYLAGNDVALPIVWDFVKEHYSEIENRFGTDNRYFARMVPGIVTSFTTEERLLEVQEFFDATEAGAGVRAREQALETIQMVIDWKKKYAAEVTAWLQQR